MPDFIEEIVTQSKLCSKIYSYDEVDSTNNLARNLIEEKNQVGFVIVAQRQSSGKGQADRLWESPTGGLWSSLAIRPQIELSSLGMVPILSAVGITKALETFDVKTKLKWPNDILISHNLKKIGGILVEGKLTQFSLDYLIIGIGLNINNTVDQYSPALQEQITTVFEEFNMKIDLSQLLLEIINQIEDSFEILRSYGALALLNEWKQKDNILGMNVIVQSPEGEYHGKAVDISPNGQLVLEISESKKVNITTGTVIIARIQD
ncbi:MAG: biotin--[acetyl-CoA-carboxylase] ligase [Candidatus Heimdallarchaeota archaeon]|nr:MAG: biotin--[acetyl-CoA-carboxylase] ligase [Candidatus Heimdallarchaeota archaeon]